MTSSSKKNLTPRSYHSRSFLSLAARHLLCASLLVTSMPAPVFAQSSPPSVSTDAYSAGQLDALLAPIALYPDQLLTQVLMASSYPDNVIAAARWVQAPANKDLTGQALETALATQSWDPSVKSLVPFPQVLTMMNDQPEWLQQLGYAMGEQQGDVMDSIQRLRLQAQIAGQLKTTTQQVVTTQGSVIIIAPAQPSIVYVPVYNPVVVYGVWRYPAYPPVYLPPPPAYYPSSALVAGLAFGTGVAISAGLWGWASPNWGHKNVYVNVNHYNNINVNRPPLNNSNWQPRPPAKAPGGGYRPPSGPVGAPGYRPPAAGKPPQARPPAVQAPRPVRPNPPAAKPPGVPRPAQPSKPPAGQNTRPAQPSRPPAGQPGKPSGQPGNRPPAGAPGGASRPAAPAQPKRPGGGAAQGAARGASAPPRATQPGNAAPSPRARSN